MVDAIKSLLASKKTWSAIATAIVWIVAKFGLNLSAEEANAGAMMVGSLVVAYALADWGKGDVPAKKFKEVLYELLSSRKFVVVAISSAVWAAARIGFKVSPDTISTILNGATALVLSIGFADFGKEAALAETATSKKKK